MRVLLAFDKFKDALSAHAATDAVAMALREKHPDWQLDRCPLTDGGEDFAEILGTELGADYEEDPMVRGPRGGRQYAPLRFVSTAALTTAARQRLGLSIMKSLAVVDLASASGLALLPPDRRDPWQTTTFGTGELLAAAATGEADAILLGIGGSATNDAGIGALTALGLRCYDARGVHIPLPTPANFDAIARLDLSGLRQLPPLFIACDVTNPLLGPNGATATFGPQKGLRPEDLSRLETTVARIAGLLSAATKTDPALANTPGAGAAGGIAFGLMAATNARLVPGFDLVSDWLDLPHRLASADLILTGEGRFDATSLGGKGPGSLVRAAADLGKPVHVFAGSVSAPPVPGAHYHAITPGDVPLAQALPRTAELLSAAIHRVF